MTIREEIGQVNAYIKIENYHFENAIHFEMDVEDEMMELGCINLILQPFVENAIMYSLAKVPDRESCHIVLRASLEDGEVRFQIEDDGIGMSKEEAERILDGTENGPGKGYGVKNVNFRIKLCYGEAYGVSYESERGRGTRAVIRIPAMTPEELEESILL